MNEETKKSKPVAKLKISGTGASVSIWKNEARNGDGEDFYSFSLQRTYERGNELRNTSSFPIDNTDVVRLLLTKVDDWNKENAK